MSKGFAMAEKDLAGFMNDEIEEGITRSRDLIDTGINELETDIFNPGVNASELNALNMADAKSGSLLIRTKDGDEVQLRFESVKQFSASSFYSASENNQDADTSNEDNQGSSSQQVERYQYFESNGISFSLKGELDDEELTAIADLVEQTQDLADTFTMVM